MAKTKKKLDPGSVLVKIDENTGDVLIRAVPLQEKDRTVTKNGKGKYRHFCRTSQVFQDIPGTQMKVSLLVLEPAPTTEKQTITTIEDVFDF